jgi:hypothetical protein
MKKLLLIFAVILSISSMSCKVTAWEDKTSDTYWVISEADWDGSKWSSHDYGSGQWVVLYSVGAADTGWAAGYRPDKVRITFTNSESGLIDYDIGCSGPMFVNVENVASGTIQTMEYSALGEYCSGIDLLRIFSKNTEQQFQVTKIEFGFTSSVRGASMSGVTLR